MHKVVGSGRNPERARINTQQLGKAVQVMPWHRPLSGWMGPGRILDCDFVHLGLNAHEMSASRLEYRDELRDSAGKSRPGDERLYELSFFDY